MKHTLFTCAKWRRLKHRLSDQMECSLVGALEMLFHFGNANGDILNACDVEAVCGWTQRQQAGELLAALTDTGDGAYTNFLDVLDDGKVRIHDFWEHAPDCVKSRKRQQEYREQQKRNKTFVTVCDSNVTVCDNNERLQTVCYSNDKRNETKRNETICIEDQSNNNSVAETPKQGLLLNEEDDKEFEEFWKAYPQSEHKDRKTDALKKWKSRKLKKQFTAIMEGLERWKLSKKWSDPQYINNPANWLEGRMWMETPQENPGISKDSLRARLLAAHNVKGLNS